MKNSLFFFFVLISISKFGFSQFPKPISQVQYNGNWSDFNREGKMTTDLKIDRDNNLWIVTFGSVTKYDGTTFKKIKDPQNYGNAAITFHETQDGKKFVMDYKGKLFWIEQDSLRPYDFNDSLTPLNPEKLYTDVDVDKLGRLHISYRGTGYYTMNNGVISQPLKDRGYNLHGFACIIREGKLPFMVKAISKDSIDKPYHFYLFDEHLKLIDQQVFGAKQHNLLSSIVQKKNGNFLYTPGGLKFIEFCKDSIIQEVPYNHPINRLLVDKDGGLWINVAGFGIHYYEEGSIDSTDLLAIKDSLRLVAAAQDFQGGIWCYSPELGLRYISDPYVRYYEKGQPFQYKNAADIKLIINEKYLDSQHKKIMSLNKETGLVESINLPDSKTGFNHNIRYNQVKNEYWAIPPGALLHYQNGKWNGIPLDKWRDMVSDGFKLEFSIDSEKGSAIGIAINQFFICNDSTVSYVSPKYPQLISDVDCKGDSCYVLLQIGKLFLQVNDEYINLGDQYPQLDGVLASTELVNDELWVSTYDQGVFVLGSKGLKQITYKHYNLNASYILKGPNKEVWLLNKQGSFEFLTDGRSYDSSINAAVYRPVPKGARFFRDETNPAIHFLSKSKMLGKIDFKYLKKDTTVVPKPQFETLKINRQPQKIHDSIYQMEYDGSFIQISYTSVSYKNEPIAYRYRMNGLDEYWNTSNQNYTQYTTLPAGEYTFELQSKIGEQEWSAPSFLYFEIMPPIWQRWWFLSITGVVILLIIVLVVRTRESRQRKKVEQELALNRQKHLSVQSELKALRAQMNPHFTFNMLNAIQATVNKSDPESATKYIVNTASLIRKVLENSKEKYTTLEEELNLLRLYIELEQFRFSNCFQYKIEIEELIDPSFIKIPSMVVQPYIENAIIHGMAPKREGGKLLLFISRVNDQLKFVIEDNGIGRKQAIANKEAKSFAHNSMAMGITKDRLDLYQQEMGEKFSIKVEDLVNESLGTRVELLFPLHNN